MNLELKTNPVPDLLVSKVLDAMIRFEVLDQYLISSFDIQAMQRFARAHPNIRCGVICKSQTPEIWQGEWVFVIAKWKSLTPDFLQQAQKHGKKVIAWTVDNKRTMRSLMKRGVKRLITDTPDSYIELLQNKKYLDSK